ncbi:hypothetical protein P3T76_005679 [Phytophthora citrophthora]|uniref:Uncharacterized protein n=1 Tax=Phytophthora citrophthora TaxID=4793 RepID=A0AAD9LPV0_9STRA|nr:hypothetical protein P3T76_005679 [Phytophthora citrophthora]
MAPVPAATDERKWVQIHDWADSTMKNWSKQAKAEVRRQHRCESMARLRVVKKNELQERRREREELELQVKKSLAVLNEQSLKTAEEDAPTSDLSRSIHRLALESDALRTENGELSEKLQTCERFQSLVQDNAFDIFPVPHEDNCSSSNVYSASKMSPWVPNSSRLDAGWRVKYQNGEPSFHFQPFTKEEFEDAMQLCEDKFGVLRPPMPVTGRLFGWTVHHAPPTRRQDNALVGRVRLSARVNCSFETADEAISPSKFQEWPLLVTPPYWSELQRRRVNLQVLQSFAIDAHVMVCNVPGTVHTRYFQLARRQFNVEANGKRSLTLSLMISDSEENKRIQTAEDQSQVKWIEEGGAYIRIIEVDDNTIDISSDTWAQCEDEQHARHHSIRWTQFVCRWSQTVMATKLLEGR